MDIRRDLCYGQKKAATGGNPTTEVSIQAWRDINIPKQIQFQMSICHGRPPTICNLNTPEFAYR